MAFNFKERVDFYLKNPMANPLYVEEDEIEGADFEDEVEDKEDDDDTCPECGKDPCECKKKKKSKKHSSASTKTVSDDDDDQYHASAATGFRSGGITPEEDELKKEGEIAAAQKEKFREKSKEAVRNANPGAQKILDKYAKASVKDDHTNGRNGSCKTVQESLLEEFGKMFR